ncbi:replication-relaxation family protein [bacterium]|nr:replication-relaxation family protein [bacterium]
MNAFDGMLGFSQLKRMFFTGTSQAKQRLKLLYQNKYLNRPGKEQRRRIPEMIYWLDKGGAKIVSSLNGTPLNEFSWRKQPRWFQVEHDLAVNDFRLDMEQACKFDPDIELVTWTPESEFWAFPDKVSYSYQDRSQKRKIRPDGYFMLSTPNHNIRYLLEIDRGTEDNPRFLREKILPGLAYIETKAYKNRFGHNSGRWLVVTTGKKRLANMLRQAKRAGTEGKFYFTTFDQLSPQTILQAPIWQREDRDEVLPLVFLD